VRLEVPHPPATTASGTRLPDARLSRHPGGVPGFPVRAGARSMPPGYAPPRGCVGRKTSSGGSRGIRETADLRDGPASGRIRLHPGPEAGLSRRRPTPPFQCPADAWNPATSSRANRWSLHPQLIPPVSRSTPDREFRHRRPQTGFPSGPWHRRRRRPETPEIRRSVSADGVTRSIFAKKAGSESQLYIMVPRKALNLRPASCRPETAGASPRRQGGLQASCLPGCRSRPTSAGMP
jgi:hypothetical protein